MNVRVTCQGCQQKFAADEKHAGKIAKCPTCGSSIRVPAPPEGADSSKQTSSRDSTSTRGGVARNTTPGNRVKLQCICGKKYFVNAAKLESLPPCPSCGAPLAFAEGPKVAPRFDETRVTNDSNNGLLLVLNKDNDKSYAIDLENQQVADPKRAEDYGISEAFRAAAEPLLSTLFVLLLTALMAGVAFLFIWLGVSVGGKAGAMAAGLGAISLMFICPCVAVLALTIGPLLAVVKLCVIKWYPDTTSVEGTLNTFFRGIKDNLWRRAYNCLTDSAQAVKRIPLKIGNAQKLMPNAEFDSLSSFQRFWRYMEQDNSPRVIETPVQIVGLLFTSFTRKYEWSADLEHAQF